jgi:HK97 family phage prohead protease
MRDRAGAAPLSRGAAPYTSLREWRAQAVAGKTPTDVVLRKAYTCEKIVTVDAAARQKQFVISTASVDREGDTVAPEGWVLDEYRANPVVLWAHDGEQPPIGQTVRMGVDGGRKLLSIVQFAPREVYAFADTIYQLVDGGYIRAASVGFLPIEFQFDSHREGSGFAPPCNFTKQALLEWSVCPVPANPDCLVQARAAGIELAPLLGWAERILDEGLGEPGVWISRAEAAAVHKLLGTTTHSLPSFDTRPAGGASTLIVRTLPGDGEEVVDLVDEPQEPADDEPATDPDAAQPTDPEGAAADADGAADAATPPDAPPAAADLAPAAHAGPTAGEGTVVRDHDPLTHLASLVDAEPVTRMPSDPVDDGAPDAEDPAMTHAKKALATAQAATGHLQKAVDGLRHKAVAPLDPSHHLHTAKGYMDIAAAHAGIAHGLSGCPCGPLADMGGGVLAAAPAAPVVRAEPAAPAPGAAPPLPPVAPPPATDPDEDVLADLDPAEMRAMIQAGVTASIETRMRLAAGRVD